MVKSLSAPTNILHFLVCQIVTLSHCHTLSLCHKSQSVHNIPKVLKPSRVAVLGLKFISFTVLSLLPVAIRSPLQTPCANCWWGAFELEKLSQFTNLQLHISLLLLEDQIEHYHVNLLLVVIVKYLWHLYIFAVKLLYYLLLFWINCFSVYSILLSSPGTPG